MKIIIMLLLATNHCYASFTQDGEDFNYTFSKSIFNETGMNEKELQQVASHIKSVVKKDFLVKLQDSSRINAFATFDETDNPLITVTKGMLEHELMNKNVLALLICHELGHFYGGFPKQKRGNSDLTSWSTAEGQADYYSILVCAKNIVLEKSTTKNFKFCDQDLKCEELTQAALSLSQIYAQVKFWPYPLEVDSPDPNVVYHTELNHPNPQCRLDTMIQAIECSQKINLQKDKDLFITCLNKENRQPGCWFAPNLFPDI